MRAFLTTTLLLLALVAVTQEVTAVELTDDNFEDLTTGKVVFLKFYDPM